MRSGLDNAGKSTILSRWLHPKPVADEAFISPTFGFDIKTHLVSERCRLNFWDIGGQKTLRPFWRNYYEETDAVVWVVDSADRDRLHSCREELETVLNANVHGGG